jgi:hypothetical protein
LRPCPPPPQLIKYGVVRLAELQRDLLHWATLYCAGRMHKPVATLAAHPAVAAAQQRNLRAALRVALLLLPPRFSTRVRVRGWLQACTQGCARGTWTTCIHCQPAVAPCLRATRQPPPPLSLHPDPPPSLLKTFAPWLASFATLML